MTISKGRELSRRFVLRSSGALAATSLAMPWVARGAYAQNHEGAVVFGGLGGSTQKIFEEDVIPSFTERTGIQVQYEATRPNNSVAKLRAQPGATGLDVVQLTGTATAIALEHNLLQTVDYALIPNAESIDSSIPREPHLVPFSVSGVVLIYQKEVFEKNGWAAPTKWDDLWDPRFAGHTVAYGMTATGGLSLLFQAAKDATGDYKNLDAGFARMAELRKNILEFVESAGAWETLLQQGDLWLGVNSFTRGLQMTQAGMPIGVVFPDTGVPSYQIVMGIVDGAPHPKAAHAWVNHLLDKDIQAAIATKIGYVPPTNNVTIPADVAALLPTAKQMWFPDWEGMSSQFPAIVDRWQREIER